MIYCRIISQQITLLFYNSILLSRASTSIIFQFIFLFLCACMRQRIHDALVQYSCQLAFWMNNNFPSFSSHQVPVQFEILLNIEVGYSSKFFFCFCDFEYTPFSLLINQKQKLSKLKRKIEKFEILCSLLCFSFKIKEKRKWPTFVWLI